MIFQRSSEYIRYQGSLEDLRKIFEIGGPPGILERYLPTKIIRGCSEEQRVQRSSKDLWKIFEMKTRSSICGRSSRSKIFQKFSEFLRYRRSFRYRRAFKDLRKISRSKINQGSSEKASISKIIRGCFSNTRCYFRRAILLSFGHRGLLVVYYVTK